METDLGNLQNPSTDAAPLIVSLICSLTSVVGPWGPGGPAERPPEMSDVLKNSLETPKNRSLMGF